MPSAGTLTSVTYEAGPDATALQGPLQATDYVIDGETVRLTDTFIARLHAGEHEFQLVKGSVTLTFYLCITPGDVVLQVDKEAGAPAVTANASALEVEERGKQQTIDEMELGYNVYIDVVVKASSNGNEQGVINAGKGRKTLGEFVDITVIKKARNASGQYTSEPLTQVTSPILLTIDIPQTIRGQRNYLVVRGHTEATAGVTNYIYSALNTTLVGGGTQLSFESDKFSTFAILYDKASSNSKSPQTHPGAVLPDDSNDLSGDLGVSARIKQTLETDEHVKYLNGYADGTVRSDNAITRAEVASIFFRLLKASDKNDPVGSSFADVTNGAWYAQAVNYLAKLGVLEGYADGTFKPNQSITRAEFAAVVTRLDDLEKTATNPFPDVTTDYWAYDYILSAYVKGWVSGYPDGRFAPQNSITRAEVVTVVNRMLGRRLAKEDVPQELHTLYTDLHTVHWAFSDAIEASVAHTYSRKANGYEIWMDY